ncbi:MAG: hypothetical protein WCP12_06210 [bacterium]
MKYSFLVPILCCLCLTLRAEQLWVATIETDSLQSLQLSISAFTQTAALPGNEEDQTSLLQNLFMLPSLECINERETLRVFWVADSTRPLGTYGNPAPISVLPLKRDTKALDAYLFNAYKSKRSLLGTTTYSVPVSTNSPECVVVQDANRTITLAPSRALLAWLQAQPIGLASFLPRKTDETLRLNFNPRILAELLPLKTQDNPYTPLVHSCAYTGLGINPDGRGCTVTLYVQPKALSVLDTLLNDMPAPKPELWNAIPENAIFSTLYTEPAKTNWSAVITPSTTNAFATIFADLQPFLGRERLFYLVPTQNREGMSFVQIAPVTNENATRESIKKLATRENKTGFRLKHERTRKMLEQVFERYTLTYQPAEQQPTTNAPTATTSISVATVMPLFLRNAVLEVTLKNGHLIAVASSASTIESECPDCPFPIPRLTLKQRIMTYSSSPNIIAAGDVSTLAFLRQLIAMLASSDIQSKKLFSSLTDGFQFWLTSEANNTTALSIRLAANEIASLQKAFREDREALQDTFFTLFTNQMQPVNEAPKQKP